MKNILKTIGAQSRLLCVLAIVLIVGLSIIACGNSKSPTNIIPEEDPIPEQARPASSTYSWIDNGYNYTLTIEAPQNNKSAVKTGTYVLVITNLEKADDVKISEGTAVAGSNGEITFTPDYSGATTFVITISGSSEEPTIIIAQGVVIAVEGGTITITVAIDTTGTSVTDDGIGSMIEYKGRIANYDGAGTIHAIYWDDNSDDATTKRRNNIGTVSAGGVFSFSLKDVPVNTGFNLYDALNWVNENDSITGTINVDKSAKAIQLMPIVIKPNDTSGGFLEYELIEGKHEEGEVIILYVDRPVTIKGTRTIRNKTSSDNWTSTDIWDVSLPKGWNVIYSSYTRNDTTSTYISRNTSVRPAGYVWWLFDNTEACSYTLTGNQLTISIWGDEYPTTYTLETGNIADFPVGKWSYRFDWGNDFFDYRYIEFKADKTLIIGARWNTEKESRSYEQGNRTWYHDGSKNIIYHKYKYGY
jgi:hypothetical protein